MTAHRTLRTLVFAAVIALSAVLAGCGDTDRDSDTGKLRVAVTVPPHAWLVKRIGGPFVTVVTLATPGESPETYQPSEMQVTEVMRSKILFRTGVPFENGRWLSVLEKSNVRIVDLRERIELIEDAHGHGDDHQDPHIWLSPRLLMEQARTVCEALQDAVGKDDKRHTVFEASLLRLVAELKALDSEIADKLATFGHRRIYVYHPAWDYFCGEYHLHQVALQKEGKEPSDSETTELIGQARADGVKAIFVQEQIAGRSAKAVANAIGAEIVRLDPLAEDVPANLRATAAKIAKALAR